MKDAKGHGSNSRGMPLKGHDFHTKSNEQLRFIAKDAAEAAQAMRGHSPQSEGKYLDQVNDASTVLGFRQRGGVDLSAPAAHQTGVQAVPANRLSQSFSEIHDALNSGYEGPKKGRWPKDVMRRTK